MTLQSYIKRPKWQDMRNEMENALSSLELQLADSFMWQHKVYHLSLGDASCLQQNRWCQEQQQVLGMFRNYSRVKWQGTCRRMKIQMLLSLLPLTSQTGTYGLKSWKFVEGWGFLTTVLKIGVGELIVVRRSHQSKVAEDYLSCLNCCGFKFEVSKLWRHVSQCRLSNSQPVFEMNPDETKDTTLTAKRGMLLSGKRLSFGVTTLLSSEEKLHIK